MTIDEADNVLLDIELNVPVMRPKRERDAIQLGREALKRCKSNGLNPRRADFRPLPGETGE